MGTFVISGIMIKLKVIIILFFLVIEAWISIIKALGSQIKPLEEEHFWVEVIRFLENTNIVYYDWELIEYEEEKGVFEKTFDKILGNDNKYHGGQYKSI